MGEENMGAGNIGWSERVAYSGTPGSDFAYTPNEVIVHGQAALDRAIELIGAASGTVVGDPDEDADGNFRVRCTGVDVIDLIEDLRLDNHHAEPNFVFFAHDLSANPLYGNPLYGNPLYGNPLYGNPLYGNPLYGNPLYGNPLYGNPSSAQEYMQTGLRPNSARPADPREYTTFAGTRSLNIIILDSGLADPAAGVNELPPLLSAFGQSLAPEDRDSPDSDGDDTLDPVAGHGTFIAGLIELLTPGLDIKVRRVFKLQGDVNQWELGTSLDAITGNAQTLAQTLLNLSFGGYATRDLRLLPQKLRKLQAKGVVVVASAGNDGTSRPLFPAALKDVVSVGALGPNGPAWFSNYGSWVRACAPGVELVSSFFENFDGPVELTGNAKDPDQFNGWAYWSGTSFAAPGVVAALAREMKRVPCTAKEAVVRIIDAPGLFRIPGLGTVVNIA